MLVFAQLWHLDVLQKSNNRFLRTLIGNDDAYNSRANCSHVVCVVLCIVVKNLLRFQLCLTPANSVNVFIVEVSTPVRDSVTSSSLRFYGVIIFCRFADEKLKTKPAGNVERSFKRFLYTDRDRLRMFPLPLYCCHCTILCVLVASLLNCFGINTTDLCWYLMNIIEMSKTSHKNLTTSRLRLENATQKSLNLLKKYFHLIV